ncbi:MAG: DUF1330 domain-containing protein [Alphaproteobacteria bacterium]|nr:DUF1330 domain-containing protein [Alphaproteobacteria bacterium]
MTAYIIFQETVHDAEAFERYKQLSPASISKFCGEFVVRGGQIETLEGSFEHERVVIIAFPDAEHARDWHRSIDYAEAKAMRLKICSGDAILVEGVE